MKTSTIRALAFLGLTATLGSVSAMAQIPTNFSIPFGFTVGEVSFRAGHYRVSELSRNVTLVRAEDGHASAVVLTQPDEPGKVHGQVTLTFTRYGDRYFLSKVADGDRGSLLHKSAAEQELIAGRASPKRLDIIASSRK